MVRKGDRVEFFGPGGSKELLFGVMVSVGAKSARAIMDGAEMEMKGDPRAFRPSTHPLPKDPPHEMDRWGVSAYREFKHGHGDSATFHANITLDGKKVMTAENDGWGGSNLYSGPRAIQDQFHKDSEKWAQDHGSPFKGENGDLWVDWKQNKQPYGLTAKAYFADCAKDMASHGIQPDAVAPSLPAEPSLGGGAPEHDANTPTR